MGSPQRRTRLTRAVEILEKALGDRRYVLVYESTHREAPVAGLHYSAHEHLALWEIRGLLSASQRHFARAEADLRRRRR